jgi:hypothetical protein
VEEAGLERQQPVAGAEDAGVEREQPRAGAEEAGVEREQAMGGGGLRAEAVGERRRTNSGGK